MARRRGLPPVNPIRTGTPEALPPAPEPDTRSEEERVEDDRVGFTIRLLKASLTHRQVVEALRRQYGIGYLRAGKLLNLAREELLRIVEARKPYARAEQLARLHADLARIDASLGSDPTPTRQEMGSLLRTRALIERVVAEIEGTKAPTEQVIRHEFRGAVMGVLANLSDDKARELLERAQTRKRLAEST